MIENVLGVYPYRWCTHTHCCLASIYPSWSSKTELQVACFIDDLIISLSIIYQKKRRRREREKERERERETSSFIAPCVRPG